MKKVKWVKQLTRENTLLDRSLRTVAYDRSLREIGRASISKCPIVGQGKVTSMYYSPDDYRNQQKIILKEFKDKNIAVMGESIIEFLEQGYSWAKNYHKKKIDKNNFPNYFNEFNYHHAHSRGAIVYGYWGEPVITKKLKALLSKKIKKEKIDHTLSLLSAPKTVDSKIKELYHPSKKVEKEKQNLINQLKLNKEEKELIEILSWFTFFYELGERVSSLLYDELLKKIKQLVRTSEEYDLLMWYDPQSLVDYFKNKKISQKEILDRKQMYILMINKGKLRVLAGQEAINYFNYNFKEELPKKVQEIKGTVASLGKAKGQVKIVITQDDQRKMKKGDILVSTMTTPRLMSAVKMAAAIVTDEGGLTAHAAIVARELNIPCIVGTKIATKVLKDGDIVEVDANKGIVKKLNK
jgi:phosphohistidine swiveling domain-containing protein